MLEIIHLTTEQLAGNFPQNLRHQSPGGVAYTLSHPEAFGVEVPIYRDPSHLAAWLAGFAAYNNLLIDQHNAEKEN